SPLSERWRFAAPICWWPPSPAATAAMTTPAPPPAPWAPSSPTSYPPAPAPCWRRSPRFCPEQEDPMPIVLVEHIFEPPVDPAALGGVTDKPPCLDTQDVRWRASYFARDGAQCICV